MSDQTTRFLIVFSSQKNGKQEFENRIRYYKEMIKQSRSVPSFRVEYFLLYVAPHVPSFALQSPEIVQFAIKEIEKGEQILKMLGETLNIKVENQYISEGNPDFQARNLAIELGIDTVLGYSKTYIKFLKIIEALQKYTLKYFKKELKTK